MAFEIGQAVGNYRILERLGAGGMGEVFLAEHPLIGKTVALKVIHQDMSLNKELVARFVNEAKAVSTIGNDHIVEVHDFGTTEGGAHFFIMEHLQGLTLAKALSCGQLSLSDPAHVGNCLHIAAQVAAGLAAAHDNNIIHRDLKPDNIMLIHKLGDPLFVKILDFGLAKMLESDAQLTATGVVLGTPEFMSPEAAESKDTDGRSDIYSCGVLLFLMLTGRLPFIANSMGEMMVQHVCQAPPVPRSFNPQISPAVEQIVLRCLAKNREDRFQTMHELHAALMNPEGYLTGSPKVVASDGAPRSASAERDISPHPALMRPAETSPHTMNIGTPVGYGAGGRRRFGFLVAIALLSGGGGVAAALAQDDSASTDAAHGTEMPTEVPVATKTTSATPDKEEPAPEVLAVAQPDASQAISLRVNSEPQGALVVDEAGETVGTTPFDWQAEAPQEVAWRFTHDGYELMTYRFTPSGDEPVLVSLVAKRSKRKHPIDPKRKHPIDPKRKHGTDPKRQPKKPAKVQNNLIAPDL